MAWQDYWNDWSASDNLMMAPTRPIAFALASALNERLLVTGRTVIDLDMAATMEPNKLLRTVAGYLRDDAGADTVWADFCESQAASDGIFTSGTVPAYTASSIIYHTDAYLPTFLKTHPADRFRFIIGDPVTAAACWRMRQTIDACTWQRTITSTSSNTGQLKWTDASLNTPPATKYSTENETTWADIVAAWSGVYDNNLTRSLSIRSIGFFNPTASTGEYYTAQRYTPYAGLFPNTTQFDYDADLYLKVITPPFTNTTFDGEGIFPNPGTHYLMGVTGKNGNALFDMVTQIPCDLPPEPDGFFYASGSGNPDTNYSGAITSLTIDFAADPGVFSPTGTLRLIAGNVFDNFAYTAVSGSGTSRTFTCSTTLTGSYTSAASASAFSGTSSTGASSAGWMVETVSNRYAGNCAAVTKWDASNGAGFQFRSDT